MKKRTLLLISAILYMLFALLATKARAQNIGINPTGATPNASAGLDIDFTNKGLLIPRVALTSTASASPLTSPATSVLVYNTATAGSGTTAVSPGYYYWTGSAWTKLVTAAGSSGMPWQLGGNSGTSPGTNYIGTADAQDLVFKTNNTESYRVSAAGDIGIGTIIPEEKLHLNTGNMLLDNGIALRGRSLVSSSGKANIIRSIGNEVEFGSSDPYQNFNAMKLYVPVGGSGPDDGYYDVIAPGSFTEPLMHFQEDSRIGINTSTPEETFHLANGNMFFDNGVILKGKSMISSSGKANIMRVISNEVEFGSSDPYENFNAMKLYLPIGGSGPDDGYYDIIAPGSFAAPLLHFQEDSRIGINTNVPEETLHLANGNMLFDNGVALKGRCTASSSGKANMIRSVGNEMEIGSSDPYQNFNAMKLYVPSGGSGSSDGYFDVIVPSIIGTLAHFQEDGKIGINNNNPSAMLDLNGTFKMTDGTQGAGKILTSDASGNATWQTPSSGSDWKLTGNSGTTPGTNFIGTTDAQDLVIKTSNTEQMRLSATGDLGIGTSSPSSKVHAVSETFWGSWYRGDSYGGGWGTTFEGRRAMGTIASPVTMTAGNTLVSLIGRGYVAGSGFSSNYNAGILMYADGTYTTSSQPAYIVFQTTPVGSAGASERMRITAAGNVGIGTLAPATKLDVAGTIRSGGPSVDGQLLLYSEQGATDWTYTVNPNAAATQNVILTLPPNDGNANEVLTTDGSGNLSWSAASSTAWGLTGNAGTTASNFIGTTDSVALQFKVNNHLAGRIGLLNSSDENTSFGGNSMRSVTTGFRSTSFGSASLEKMTSGVGNTAFGSNTLKTVTTTGGNSAFGSYALESNTGSSNTAMGNVCMRFNTSGSDNTAIGTIALNNNTTASGNIAIGNGALNAQSYNGGGSTWYSYNVAVGLNALTANQPTSTSTGIDNTAVGRNAGATNTTGFNNTFIGYNANGSATIDNASAFGANANVTSSDALVLGGTGTNAVNVGIGVTAPTERLTVSGNETTAHGRGACIGLSNTSAAGYNWFIRAGGSGTFTPYGGFSIADNSAYRLTIDASGNTGIATISPLSTLEVNGTVGMKVKTAQVAGTNNPDNTGEIWLYTSGTGTITLPAANTCANRMYVILNQTGASRTTSNYNNFSGAVTSSIATGTSIWIISDGTNWQQIK